MFFNTIKTTLLLGLLMGVCLALGSLWGRQGVFIGFLVGGGGALFSYFFSDSLALASVGAIPLEPQDYPQVHQMVADLAQRANIPMPRLYVSPEQAPNAFATGRNPAHGVVCLTQGLLEMMNPKELQGVVAHELAHIKHRDILISTMAAVMAGAISQLAYMASWGAMGSHRDDREGGGHPILAILMLILAPIAAMLIQMAVSRSREYAADEGGSSYAGGPEGLISALRKLELANHQIPMNINPSSSHMFIVKPLIPSDVGELFRTHPPTEKRIAHLIEIMGRP